MEGERHGGATEEGTSFHINERTNTWDCSGDSAHFLKYGHDSQLGVLRSDGN